MNRSTLSKWAGVSLLMLGLMTLPTTRPAFAQSSSSTSTSTTVDNSDSTSSSATDTDHSDGNWGLLGLLGLFGLFGRRSSEQVPTAYEDPDVVINRTGDR